MSLLFVCLLQKVTRPKCNKLMNRQSLTIHLCKLPKCGTACTKFSVRLQLIVMLWHGLIPMYPQETWIIHNQCAHVIAHHPVHPLPDGTWEYPPTEEVLDFCGLSDISTYIAWCKTRLLNRYTEPESPLYNLCKNSTPIGNGAHFQMCWT
jgi:hypothetical protein